MNGKLFILISLVSILAIGIVNTLISTEAFADRQNDRGSQSNGDNRHNDRGSNGADRQNDIGSQASNNGCCIVIL